jgi:flagellar hook-associated protein 3 FlgL
VRITHPLLVARTVEAQRRGLAEMARLERQIATGIRLRTLSESPLDGRAVLEIDADTRAHAQYARNIETARSRLAAEDANLEAVGNILARAREIAIQHGSATGSTATRVAAAAEVRELREAIVQLANSRTNETYLFGGAYADRPPLDASGALDPSRPARGTLHVEIGPGMVVASTHDAGEVFVDSDVIGALQALEAALAADDSTAVQATVGRLRAALARVQDLVAEVGARQARLDLAQASQTIVVEGLEARRSGLFDADLAEAVTRLAARRASYEASLLATSRLMESSLVHYLR